MELTFDNRVIELLSARLCHDLINPVAAIGNGVELISEFREEMAGEAIALIGDSAKAASSLLQFYRVAFGSARAADGGGIGLGEARRRALACLGSPRIDLVWPDDGDLDRLAVGRDGVKLLLNVVLVAVEALPGAGRVVVGLERDGARLRAAVSAAKDGFVVPDDMQAVLDGRASVDELTPYTVVAYYARRLAEAMGGTLEVAGAPGRLSMAVELRVGGEA